MRTSSPLLRTALLAAGLALLTSGFLSGCATSTYGQAPVKDE